MQWWGNRFLHCCIDFHRKTIQQFCSHKVISPVSFSVPEALASRLSSSADLLSSQTLAGLQQPQGKCSALPNSVSTHLHSQDGQYIVIKLLHVSYTSKQYICPPEEEKCDFRRSGKTNSLSFLWGGKKRKKEKKSFLKFVHIFDNVKSSLNKQ